MLVLAFVYQWNVGIWYALLSLVTEKPQYFVTEIDIFAEQAELDESERPRFSNDEIPRDSKILVPPKADWYISCAVMST